MTTQTFLPVRPSLESLRKQAKKLARDVAGGNAEALARVRVQLPGLEPPLLQRDAQLVIAREYGFPGWKGLTEEVYKRLGQGLEWAAIQAKHAIRNDDVERLQQWLKDFPGLLSWRDDRGWTLLEATAAFRDSFDPEVEKVETRPRCAEAMIDAGCVVDASMCRHVVETRARGMLRLFRSKGALPRTPLVLTALGDLEGVRECFDSSGRLRADLGEERGEAAIVNEAFFWACRYEVEPITAFLLDRCIALDAELPLRIEAAGGRSGLIAALKRSTWFPYDGRAAPPKLWQAAAMEEAMKLAHDDDPAPLVQQLQREAWLLGEQFVPFQIGLFEHFGFNGKVEHIRRLLELDPAAIHARPSSAKWAVGALEYGRANVVPLLRHLWPLPDDLPHAAGTGDFANVKKWFDAAGRPVLGDPRDHFPGNDPVKRGNLHWGPPNAQQVLDTALAWAVMNRELDIATFLLERGADINTNWCTHEPASILHELVFHGDQRQIQFVIDHGIDLTIRDHRWNATAQGWAFHAKKDEKLARFLADAELDRRNRSS